MNFVRRDADGTAWASHRFFDRWGCEGDELVGLRPDGVVVNDEGQPYRYGERSAQEWARDAIEQAIAEGE